MNAKNILLFCIIGFVVTVLQSCEDDNGSEDFGNNQINEWILDMMETYYLWNEKIPSETDKNLFPADYFESLIYKEEDKFSWIQENFTELMESLVGIDTEPGYDFNLYALTDKSPRLVGGFITYVKPNSPAAATNLRRGQYFTHINGKEVNEENYRTLLDELNQPHKLTVVDLEKETKQDISFQLVKYEENPLLLDSIYNFDDRKVGYLVYNFFSDDPGDGSLKYAKQLNDVFGKFKARGINELVLDLRYNYGGSLSTATKMSSMISNCSTTDVFLHLQYNRLLNQYYEQVDGSDYNKLYFVNSIESEAINQLGLTTIYVLVTNRTASASEIVINGLKPYATVVLVGLTTYGKPFGSVTFYEEDEEKQQYNKWGMQPIVVRFTNSLNNADYLDGFQPDVESNEVDDVPFKQLGDINEKMLRDALIKMGINKSWFSESTLRSGKSAFGKPIWSSADRKPVRRNTYINDIKL